MDIDCDGVQGGVADDGRCGHSADTQSITAFRSTVSEYNAGIDDLNAFVHPYVVFGNQGDKYVGFEPTDYGVEPLSVMAVVCNNKVVSSHDKSRRLRTDMTDSEDTDLWDLGRYKRR